jgi:ferric-dicitrate binding protein FerR (iron transport regulator)
MFQRHRTVTPRIARMLHELEGRDTAQNRAADAAKPATDRGSNARKRTPRKGFIAAVTLIAAALKQVGYSNGRG